MNDEPATTNVRHTPHSQTQRDSFVQQILYDSLYFSSIISRRYIRHTYIYKYIYILYYRVPLRRRAAVHRLIQRQPVNASPPRRDRDEYELGLLV